jgi:hypothetical protein
MSNVFATYIVLIVALAIATPLTLAIPRARAQLRPAHGIAGAISAALLLLCVYFFGEILLFSPTARDKPELVAPFALAAFMLGLLAFKVIRAWRRNAG